MSTSKVIECQLAVIGRGMAGMASAFFAARRGVSTISIGITGETIFASGFLDLMGVHPVEEKKSWNDPWAAINALIKDIPHHPYARVKRKVIRTAFKEILTFLKEVNLPYYRCMESNVEMITPLGTVKRTYCVPHTMVSGVRALEENCPCLIVGFRGLYDFSAHQIVATLQGKWPDLRAAVISFPKADHVSELFPGEIIAQILEVKNNREKLISALRPHVKDAQAVGMPAILGIQRSQEIAAKIEDRIGVPVFEIPTMPVSVPGLRLNDAFSRYLSLKDVTHYSQSRVLKVTNGPNGCFVLKIGNKVKEYTVRAKGIILATGRFGGGGLYADRQRIRESLFDLSVYQPRGRNEWHREDFLDSRGHPANKAGIEVDDSFRPLDNSGNPAYERLFAAGSILAHQDWMRMKCGSGLAIATAYAAVNAFLELNE